MRQLQISIWLLTYNVELYRQNLWGGGCLCGFLEREKKEDRLGKGMGNFCGTNKDLYLDITLRYTGHELSKLNNYTLKSVAFHGM